MNNKRKTKVFIVCAGLGRVYRGYESSLQQTFEALVHEPDLEVKLYKGGGPEGDREEVLWNLPRNSPLAARLSSMTNRPDYWFEHTSFTLSLIPAISRYKPDIVYFAEDTIGRILWRLRRLIRLSSKLVLRNNGPIYPPYLWYDGVQHVNTIIHRIATEHGEPVQKQVFLPEGFDIEPKWRPRDKQYQAALRRRLNLPDDRPILLSVGAVNKGHKRMDYVVGEVTALPEPRPYLVMLGQQDRDTPDIRRQAQERLGEQNFAIRTVPPDEVDQYYEAADLFVLGSTFEGFGRVYVEALAHGLACLAHDNEMTRYIIGDPETVANFKEPGELARLLRQQLALSGREEAQAERHRRAYELFSWDSLKPQYVQMLHKFAMQ